MPSSSLVEIGAEPTPVAVALAGFLEHELPVSGPVTGVSLEATWRSRVDGTGREDVIPMFLVPRRSIDRGPDLEASDPDSFVRQVQDAVVDWRAAEDPPTAAEVAVVFGVTLFPAEGPDQTVMLRYAVSSSRGGVPGD